MKKRCISKIFFSLAWILIFYSPAFSFQSPDPKDLPDSINFRNESISLKDLKNPLKENPEELSKNIAEGGKIYFKNCFLCHGDLLDGNGLYGKSFTPPPADLRKLWINPPKRENYTFWRIAKGGRGLPNEFGPWNSAMPAWENVLTIEEIWKVILFIYETIQNPQVKNFPAEPSLDRGKEVYKVKCAYCHGEEGKGDGVSAPFSSPRPRNLTKGHIKFRTTHFGKIPTDEDLYKALTRGLKGTTMPSWKHLGDVDIKSLILYLKSLSKKFKKFVDRKKTHKIVSVPTPPPFDLESTKRGRELFIKNCSGCHGFLGRSDGESTKKIVNIASDAIRPRNLTKSWTFRRGHSRKDLFLTIRTGLSTTAMPRFSDRVHSDQMIWDIVNYISTLSPASEPKTPKEIKAVKLENELPLNPEDPQWKSISGYYIPLGGQIIDSEKAYFTTVDSLRVQAAYNDTELAIKLIWDDPTFDPILKKNSKVVESPAPPLPAHLQVDSEEAPPEEEPQPQEIPDALALQFPVSSKENANLPYFLNGDESNPVTLWKWTSQTPEAKKLIGKGLESLSIFDKNNQTIQTQVTFQYGQYQLVMKRKLTTDTPNEETQFENGKPIPVAFNIWDGNEGETGTKKSISSWYLLVLE